MHGIISNATSPFNFHQKDSKIANHGEGFMSFWKYDISLVISQFDNFYNDALRIGFMEKLKLYKYISDRFNLCELH